jgi:hypothetical protein
VLAKQAVYCLSHAASPFHFRCFSNSLEFMPRAGLDFLCRWDDRCIPSFLLVEMESCELFWLG